MSVIRKKFTSCFTQIYNVCYFDNRLDYIDLGIYSQLCSMPDNWNISIRKLDNFHNDGKSHRHLIQKSLNKLIGYGYIHRIEPDNKCSRDGKFECYDYEIYSSPYDNPYSSEIDFSDELTKKYNELFIKNNSITNACNQGGQDLSQQETGPGTSGDKINTGINTNINIVVDEKRIKDVISSSKEKWNEAYRTDEYSNKAEQFMIDSFNCFSNTKQIRKLNSMKDEEVRKLFDIAFGLTCNDPEYSYINNYKKFYSGQIKSILNKM